jgi:26S proteasome regulatory subunit N9
VQIVSRIGFNFDNLQNALDFFLSFMNPKSKLGSEATLCLEMDAMVCKLKLGNLEEVKLALENTLVKLNAGSFKEPMVFSKYYKASADYRKLVGTPQDFYQSALMYLTYTSMDELTDKEKYELATDLALAAICGNSVFNLGEVIATPVLKYLGGTPNSWLRDIIVALYKGDVNSFNEVVESNKNKYFSHLALSSNHEYIKRKAVLLSVLNLAFDRDPHDRTISFNEIASKSCIDCDQVEWVLMKALSIGIIKGRMNEIDQTISVTWVQPRVLDPLQITKVATQVKNWSDR